jgi:hypothetical protein
VLATSCAVTSGAPGFSVVSTYGCSKPLLVPR